MESAVTSAIGQSKDPLLMLRLTYSDEMSTVQFPPIWGLWGRVRGGEARLPETDTYYG